MHRKYNLKVILDLHAAPGSQNGFEHSSTRDGSVEWGQTDESIEESVRVIEFYTARYVRYINFSSSLTYKMTTDNLSSILLFVLSYLVMFQCNKYNFRH